MKRFICEARTEGPIECAMLVIKADCSDDAREIFVGTLGLGCMEIRIDAIDTEQAFERLFGIGWSVPKVEILPDDQRARNV